MDRLPDSERKDSTDEIRVQFRKRADPLGQGSHLAGRRRCRIAAGLEPVCPAEWHLSSELPEAPSRLVQRVRSRGQDG